MFRSLGANQDGSAVGASAVGGSVVGGSAVSVSVVGGSAVSVSAVGGSSTVAGTTVGTTSGRTVAVATRARAGDGSAAGDSLLSPGPTARLIAQEPPWNPKAMNAMFKHDPRAVPPVSIDVRMTENTVTILYGLANGWTQDARVVRTLVFREGTKFTGRARIQTALS